MAEGPLDQYGRDVPIRVERRIYGRDVPIRTERSTYGWDAALRMERRKVFNCRNFPANGLTIRYLGVLRLLLRFAD